MSLDNRLYELFAAALDRPPRERPAFLDSACEEDQELRLRIERFLAHHAEELNAPLFDPGPVLKLSVRDPLIGKQLGSYEIQKLISAGGMARVYLAARRDKYKARVAIKVLSRGSDDPHVVRRFEQEGQLAASFEHDNIVRAFDAGETDDGRPYLVMEYVEGTPLTEYCDQHSLSTSVRIELFLAVCAAVTHAHKHFVAHRDLKPDNILVATDDKGRGKVKLLDWGIAKFLKPTFSPGAILTTRDGENLMTPAYASPEQLEGKPIAMSSDVYSLGVILYNLLTGHFPYDFGTQSLETIRDTVAHEDPRYPSKVIDVPISLTQADGSTQSAGIETIAETRKCSASELRAQLAGDLDNIIMMAMRKEPHRRYQSAESLAADLRRHRDHVPVEARKPTWTYVGGKFIYRHRISVAVAAAFILGAAISVGLIVRQRNSAISASHLAETRRLQAERETQVATCLRLAAQARSVQEQHPQTALLLAMEARQLATSLGLSARYTSEALLHALAGCSGYALPHSENALAAAFSPDSARLFLSSFTEPLTIVSLQDCIPTQEDLCQLNCENAVALAVSKSGRWLAASSARNGLMISPYQQWSAARFQASAKYGAMGQHSLFLSNNDRWLLAESLHGVAYLWELLANGPAPQPTILVGRYPLTRALGISSDSRWAVTYSISFTDNRADAGAIQLWDLSSQQPTRATHTLDLDRPNYALPLPVQFSSDAPWLIIKASPESVVLMNLRAADPVREATYIQCVAADFTTAIVAPDGSKACIGDAAGRVGVCTTSAPATLVMATEASRLRCSVELMAISPDSRWLAAGGDWGDIGLWFTPSSGELMWKTELPGPKQQLKALVFSPDSSRLYSAWEDKTIRMWRLCQSSGFVPSVSLHGHEAKVESLQISPDGRWLVSEDHANRARLWDLSAPGRVAVPPFAAQGGTPCRMAIMSSDGRRAVTIHSFGLVCHWTRDACGALRPIRSYSSEQYRSCMIVADPNCRLCAIVDEETNTVMICDSGETDGTDQSIPIQHDSSRIEHAEFSGDGSLLLVVDSEGTQTLYGHDTSPSWGCVGRIRRSAEGRGGMLGGGGAVIVTRSSSGVVDIVRMHRASTGFTATEPEVVQEGNSMLGLSRNERWLALYRTDGIIMLRDLLATEEACARELATPTQVQYEWIDVSNDGMRLAAASRDGSLWAWDLGEGHSVSKPCQVLLPRRQMSGLGQCAMSATGECVAAIMEEDVYVWYCADADPGKSMIVLPRTSEPGCITFSADGQWLMVGYEDGTVQLWPLATEEMLREGRNSVGRNLTEGEWRAYCGQEPYRKTVPELPAFTGEDLPL